MESIILDPVAGILGGVDLDVVLCGVEHMGHPDPLEIVHVADRVPVADDDVRSKAGSCSTCSKTGSGVCRPT